MELPMKCVEQEQFADYDGCSLKTNGFPTTIV